MRHEAFVQDVVGHGVQRYGGTGRGAAAASQSVKYGILDDPAVS
jgi:hypothetical protein